MKFSNGIMGLKIEKIRELLDVLRVILNFFPQRSFFSPTA